MAAIACAPPTLNTRRRPHAAAAYSTAGATQPCLFGGVHRITSGQPAVSAGTASISTVENNGAVPPGIYSPTR